jgi:hypothetical protein
MLTLGCIIVSCGPVRKSEPILVVDDWWNVDYAKAGCESRSINGDPCISDPRADVRDFEAQFHTWFASDSSCHGIALADYNGPTEISSRAASEAVSTESDWQLMLDFNSGRSSQNWRLVHHSQLYSGEGNAMGIMHAVCGIINQRGGTLAK